MHDIARRTAFLIVAVVLVACGAARPGRLAADVDRYLRSMQAWAVAELEAGQAIERMIATHFVDDAEVLRQLADSRPRVRRHLHDVQGYRAETDDVRAVHRQYVDAWVALLAGYADLERGIKEGEPKAVATGREALLEWRRTLRAVAEDLRDLAEVARVPVPKREGPV